MYNCLKAIKLKKGETVMPNDIPSDSYSISLVDRSTEKSTTSFGIQDFIDLTAYTAARNAFETALATATLGTNYIRNECLSTRLSTGASGAGNRELKWLVSVTDDVTFEAFSFTLPTADDTAYTFSQNSDNLELATAPAPALVTAIEGFYKTPRGNTGTVQNIRLVGRNL